MKKIKIFTACSLSMLCAFAAMAKLQHYNYNDDMCDYQNQYDDQKHSLKQIKDTFTLKEQATSLKLNTNHVFNYSPSHPPQATVIQQFNQHYQQTKLKFEGLTPVNLPAYQELKKIALVQLAQEYELNNLLLQSYSNPKVLLTPKFGKQCLAIAHAMNLKGSALINASRKVLLLQLDKEIKAGRQDAPWAQGRIAEFEEGIQQSNATDHAYANLRHYWNNCVVWSYPDATDKLEKLNLNRDLFTKSKEVGCDY